METSNLPQHRGGRREPATGCSRRALMLGAACAVGIPAIATAQAAWPTRPVKLIVAYPPGGGTNTVARLLADQMSKGLGQQVIVENRVGASGRIGTMSVVRAEPDGYTLLFASDAELTIASVTVKAMPYDPMKDLQPITLVGKGPYLLVTNAAFPPNTLAELIAYCKANPGKVNFGSFGRGTQNHLIDARFKLAAGINTAHVPYKGSGPLIVDLVGGQVQYTFATPSATLGLVKAGKLKALAVAAPQRLPVDPSIPTMTEAGLPGFVGGSWYGLLAPANTPKAIVDRLHAEVVTALKKPEMRKALEDMSVVPVSSSPAEFAQYMQSETATLRELATKIGLEPE